MLSSLVINLTQSTYGVRILPPPPNPKYDTMKYTDHGIVKANPPLKPAPSRKLPSNGRDLRTLNAVVLLDDEPYEEEEDEAGQATGAKEVAEIEEFERRVGAARTGKQKKQKKKGAAASPDAVPEWTTEGAVLTTYAAVSKESLLPLFKSLTLPSRHLTCIDTSALSMTSLLNLDVSSNEIRRLENLPGAVVSVTANGNRIEDLDGLKTMGGLMQVRREGERERGREGERKRETDRERGRSGREE